MADDIDNAQSVTELFTEIALKNTQQQTQPTHSGFCLNCREPIDKSKPFCDADCRDDFEKRRKMAM